MRNTTKISYGKFVYFAIFLPQYANKPSHLVLQDFRMILTQSFIRGKFYDLDDARRRHESLLGAPRPINSFEKQKRWKG